MHLIYLIHKFHNLSWITEISELFHDILIYWDAPVMWGTSRLASGDFVANRLACSPLAWFIVRCELVLQSSSESLHLHLSGSATGFMCTFIHAVGANLTSSHQCVCVSTGSSMSMLKLLRVVMIEIALATTSLGFFFICLQFYGFMWKCVCHMYNEGVIYVFWLSGVTVLLSLTVFMLLVAEIMPATSDSVPLIGKSNLRCT